MNFCEFYEYCQMIFDKNKYLPEIDEGKVRSLFDLTSIMLEVNQVMNLTSIKDEKAIILKHYADSLAVSAYLDQGASIIDIGCGAGFPTLPLAIFRPDLQITAIDSTAKRIKYVSETANKLSLNNVTTIADRAEALANTSTYREKYDYATARAVAALPVLTELCLPFVRVGGKFVAMKSQKADDEIAAAKNAISKCGGKLLSSFSQPLICENGEEPRNITVIQKILPTPKDLPRHYSKISKKPL